MNFIEKADGVDMEMVWVPGGTFQMGSTDGRDDERPIHQVTLKGFWLGKFEVTQEQYTKVMGNNPSRYSGVFNPVDNVSWNNAVEFCQKLASRSAGRAYQLPSESEWEYACRTGCSGLYCFSDVSGDLNDYAWYCNNSRNSSHQIGKKRPNSYGIYDMHGNVWEWCEDGYHTGYIGAPSDGSVWESSKISHVLRGGSWYSNSDFCRSAIRCGNLQNKTDGNIGFRVALMP